MARFYVIAPFAEHAAWATLLAGMGHTAATNHNGLTGTAYESDWTSKGPFDGIIIKANFANTADALWVAGKWAAGTPVLNVPRTTGTSAWAHVASVGIITGALNSNNLAIDYAVETAHPIVGSRTPGTVVQTPYAPPFISPPAGTWHGTTVAVGATGGAIGRGAIIAVSPGATTAAGTAPTRAVFFASSLVADTADDNPQGYEILGNALSWLVGSGPTPQPKRGAGTLAVTSGLVAAGTVTQAASAFLGASSTLVADGTVVETGAGSATLGVTTSLAVSGKAYQHGTAALGVTTGIVADGTVPSEGDASATLAASSTLTADGVIPEGVGGSTLGVTTDLTVDGVATAQAAATLGVRSGLSAWAKRVHVHDPVTGRGTWRLVITHRDGTRYAEAHEAQLTRSITRRLNDTDGSGSGAAFSISRTANALPHVQQFREVQVYRGGHHFDTFVMLRPTEDSGSGTIDVQAAGLGWYFTKRRIGPPVRPELLTNPDFEQGMTGWRRGYRAGSIPAAPPEVEVVRESPDETVTTGRRALRVFGSTHVQQTVTRLGSDTTFAPGSDVLSSEGKEAIRKFAREVEIDTDDTDLVEIKPPVITIEGHTDSVPDFGPGGNMGLSERRAKAVRDFLVPLLPGDASEGTAPVVKVAWYGETRPVVRNNPTGGTAANRRVDIIYPKTVSARGHRQYVQQAIRYTNPSRHIKRNLTFKAYGKLEHYKEPNADGSVIWIGRRPVPQDQAAIIRTEVDDATWNRYLREGWRQRTMTWTDLAGKVQKVLALYPPHPDTLWVETADAKIDEETPIGTESRWEASIEVPADGKEWEIVVRLTPPAGTVVYDACSLKADDALEFVNKDQADIIRGLVEHAQDPNFGKSDLNLTVKAPKTGIKRTRVYYWHERQTIAECLAELTTLSDGVDITIDATPTKRTVRAHFPRAGTDWDVSLSTMGSLVNGYALALDGESAATTAIVQADGSGPDREEGVVSRIPAGFDQDLVLEDVWTAEPGTHIRELNEQAREAHRRYAGHVPIPTLTMSAEHTDRLLDQFTLGDTAPLDVRGVLATVRGRGRIEGESIDPDTDRITYTPTLEV